MYAFFEECGGAKAPTALLVKKNGIKDKKKKEDNSRKKRKQKTDG